MFTRGRLGADANPVLPFLRVQRRRKRLRDGAGFYDLNHTLQELGGMPRKLGAKGIHDTEKNINNKIARGGFTAAFLIQALEAIEAKSIRLEE